jgi:glycosyltransferase involved in cell wall biosynthesis
LTAFTLIVPGALEQFTGGYLFDRHVVDGLRAIGRAVAVIELPGEFPAADETARSAAAAALAGLPSGHTVVIDGLALPAFAECMDAHTGRLSIVAFVHHPLSLETGLSAQTARSYALIESRLWPMMRGLLCPSTHTAATVIATGVPAKRVRVTPPGTRAPLPAVAATEAPQPGASRALQLLAVGTVTQRKGHLQLIEALSRLPELDWHLTCVGSLTRDPACARALRDAISAHGLQHRVTLAGEVPVHQLDAAYRRADVFVLASHHEGYGMVYAEALAYHLPIVATTAGAIPDTVASDAAVLVAPGDVAALGDALRQVLTDATHRQRLAEGAARAAQDLSDWPAAVHRWAQALDGLTA